MARYRSFAEHLAPDVGPKRILALDGGGLRGVLTLGMLREIETLLRARHGDDPDFRLCDYFDLIAGTSTGAIIAAALSLGMSVDEVHGHYMQAGPTGLQAQPAAMGRVARQVRRRQGARSRWSACSATVGSTARISAPGCWS